MSDRVKIQVVPLGDWLGHPSGPEHIGEEEAQAMVARANALVEESGNPLQIDYEHASLSPPATGAPAAGWMYAFSLENDGIYAEVEWTERAREYIHGGEYKYISPVIAYNGTDPATGQPVAIELFNAALTNQPFMHDSIKQVVATAVAARHGQRWAANSKAINCTDTITRRKNAMALQPEEVPAKLASALGLPEGTTIEEIESLLKAVKAYITAMPGAPEGGAMPSADGLGEMEMEMTRTANSARILADIATELKVETDKVLPTVKAMSMNRAADDQTAQRIAALEAELAERRVTDMIDGNADRIPPADRESVRAFARKYGLEAATEMVAKLQPLPNAKRMTHESATDNPSPEFVAFRRARGRTDEQIKVEWANLNKHNTEA